MKARLAAQTDLIRKTDFDSKLKGIGDRVTKNKTKYLLVEDELKKLQKFDAAYFRGKSHFEEDGTQNYLVFQPMYRYFKRIADSFTAKNYSRINFYCTKTKVEFNGSCLKQDKVTYNHGKIVNIYIVYEFV